MLLQLIITMLFLIFSSAEYADANKQILTTSLTCHCKYLLLYLMYLLGI